MFGETDETEPLRLLFGKSKIRRLQCDNIFFQMAIIFLKSGPIKFKTFLRPPSLDWLNLLSFNALES